MDDVDQPLVVDLLVLEEPVGVDVDVPVGLVDVQRASFGCGRVEVEQPADKLVAVVHSGGELGCFSGPLLGDYHYKVPLDLLVGGAVGEHGGVVIADLPIFEDDGLGVAGLVSALHSI